MARPAIYHPLHERYDPRTMEKEKTQKYLRGWNGVGTYFVTSNKPVAADKNSATTKSRGP